MNDSTKAVIFDVGGVLVRTHDHSGRRRWEQQLGLPQGSADEVVFHSRMGTLAQQGAITDEELWLWVGEHLQLGDELPSFRSDFWAGDRLDEDLMELIRELHPKYQTAIISNATDGLMNSLENIYPIADDFDLIVGSAYERVMKPAPEIYRRTLERLGRNPSEAVFIDDAPANITGAEFVGLNAIQFTPTMDLRSALEKFGVTP
ncbi:MAG: HAD family phosphatase [Chloroflexota bacterium]